MASVKVQAKKMTGAKVSHISLVHRGANRIPFKIVKKEKEMSKMFAGMDLANLGSIFTKKSEAPAPEVVAVITMKNESTESVKKAMTDAGFKVDAEASMEDDSLVFKQGDMTEGEGVVVRLNDHIAVVTKGFSPYSMDIATEEGLSFADKCNAQGFYPGVSTVMDVLRVNIIEAAKESNDPADIAAVITTYFDEARQYVTGMVRSLPAAVFKLETTVIEPVTKAKKEEVDNQVADAAAATAATDAATADAATGDTAATTAAEDVKKEEKAPEVLTAQNVSDIVMAAIAKSNTALIEKVDTALKSVADMSEQVNKSVGEIQTTVTDMQGRVVKAEAEAGKAVAAVKGTVVGGEPAGDHQQTAKKTETGSGGFGGEIDTAMTGRPSRSR